MTTSESVSATSDEVGRRRADGSRVGSVSVVIPCYRYGNFLPDCLRSVLDEQPDVDVRALVIDDASPDDSADRARDLAAADPRITVEVHPENRGHIRTYNEGLLEWASGDYTVLLSADDRLVPGALRRAVDLLDAHPEVGFAYGHPIHYREGAGIPAARTGATGWTVWPGDWWLRRRFREATGCITSPEVVVRTEVQRQVGGYDPALPHAGDIEMWMRFAAHADVGYVKGADQAYYRIHGQNMSKTEFSGQLDDLRQRRIAYGSVLEKCGERITDAEKLARLVGRGLAKEALWRACRAYDRRRTDLVPVDELVAFARACDPQCERLPEWRGLQLRRRIGPAAMPYLQPFVLSAVTRRVRDRLWMESWKRRGI